MLITRIIAKNFKTYKDLDLDLSVEEDKPIILIGGDNGGGKTTLFQAISNALYGLNIKSKEDFIKVINAGTSLDNNTSIHLEIHFTGKVLGNTSTYKLKRSYILNPDELPVESVELNLNGNIFRYGTATPISQREKSEAEVNKIIKANLPKELSKYFLFDAMESGNLLKEEYLARVIKENIENVMGFNKYQQLANANGKIMQELIAQGIEIEEERNKYKQLLIERTSHEDKIELLQGEYERALQFSLNNKELYDIAKEGKNQQQSIRDQISILQGKKDDILNRESMYVENAEKFLNDIEIQVFVPKLASVIHNELELILNAKNDNPYIDVIDKDQLNLITNKVSDFLVLNDIIITPLSNDKKIKLANYIEGKFDKGYEEKEFSHIDKTDLAFIEQLVNWSSINYYPNLKQQKDALEKDIESLAQIDIQLAELRKNDTGGNEQIIESFEKNIEKIKEIKENLISHKNEIAQIDKKLKYFDISDEEVPNPKLELLKKLNKLLVDISDSLLVSKKSKIEESMCADLNRMLGTYKNNIDRVELSENLSNLSFKIYHKAGNEIYLDQLNAASKQIIVQVLLKSLHHYGDYNPPVMIDTVMGYLGESSRHSLLENYFPSLSHQTILLSTDTEIRKDKDLAKIESFISKKYTLVRDVENQNSFVLEGYFEN